jgi:phosphomannomutase
LKLPSKRAITIWLSPSMAIAIVSWLYGPDGRLIDGDAMIYLNALSLKKAGKLHPIRVVMTVMSNFGLRKVLEEKGIGYDTVAVGDKYVQARLKEKDLIDRRRAIRPRHLPG